MKFCSMGVKLFVWMDRQTHMMKLIIAFHNFAKAPKKHKGELGDNAMYVLHPMECQLEDVNGGQVEQIRGTLCATGRIQGKVIHTLGSDAGSMECKHEFTNNLTQFTRIGRRSDY